MIFGIVHDKTRAGKDVWTETWEAIPGPVACAVAEATPHQSLQGGQGRAAQLLSTRTPAAPGHVRLAHCRPPAQSQQLPASTSSRPPPPVQPGHWGGKTRVCQN